MKDIRSNRDLYLAIAELVETHKTSTRSLEEYLRALLSLALKWCGQVAIPLSIFGEMLAEAFTSRAAHFDESWRASYGIRDDEDASAFEHWQSTILRQIVDLREMQEIGVFHDEQRYLGTDSPRGARWYNFDPSAFIECASAGSLGGWEPGDNTGRVFVPGEVAILGEGGAIESHPPQYLERPIFHMESLTWEGFVDFLECGQMYE